MEIAYYLPASVLGNEAFADLGWTAANVFEKTGIRQRHIAGPGEFALDLAAHACDRLFAESPVGRTDIDYLLYCTQSPDHIVPNNASVLQQRLGLRNDIGALDILQGCTGFLYGLSLAKGLLLTGQARSLLLVTADTWSKYIHPRDRSARSIFGDGAAAVCIDRNDASKISNFIFGTNGKGYDHLHLKSGGLRFQGRPGAPEAADASGNVRTEANLYMNGPEVFSFTLRTVPLMVQQLLSGLGLSFGDVDHFIFHQANGFMLEHLRKKMGIPEHKFPVVLSDTGNTVSSTIPIVLRTLQERKLLREDHKVLLAGFGVGYSWNAALLTL